MNKKIAVAGTGYVGLSIATLLAQHNRVVAVDIIPEKVEMINNKKSPIQDEYIEKYLAEKDLDLTATLDGEAAYKDAEFIVIAAPTNYDSKKNYFDTSAVEAVIKLVMQVNPDAVILIAGVIHSGKLPKYSYIAELNESLRQMVEDVNRPNVKYVSVNDGFDWRIHTIADKVHPNLTGAFVMACNWFKVLNPIILQCFVEKKS